MEGQERRKERRATLLIQSDIESVYWFQVPITLMEKKYICIYIYMYVYVILRLLQYKSDLSSHFWWDFKIIWLIYKIKYKAEIWRNIMSLWYSLEDFVTTAEQRYVCFLAAVGRRISVVHCYVFWMKFKAIV